MTLSRRIIAITAALGTGLLVAGAGVVAAFVTLRQLVTSTHEEFHELCDFRKISAHVIGAQRLLAAGDLDSMDAELQAALTQLTHFDRFQRDEPSEFGSEHNREEENSSRVVFSAISTARSAARSPEAAATQRAQAALQQAYDALDNLMARTEQAVVDVHIQTAERFTRATWLVAAIEIASLSAAAVISWLLYRSVMRPLRRLREGTYALAAGKLNTRLAAKGDREFVELQHAFNRMAGELESICKNLERRVAEKSRELAIAERLASVGYLAAGVAHEINNPLAIMSGYAESLLRIAAQSPESMGTGDWIRDLETIRNEAFRCKRITQSLLDLSRLGDVHREPVEMEQIVESCVRLISAWPVCQGVKVDVLSSTVQGAKVMASELEIKQIILNLLANAVEATADSRGRVTLDIARENGWINVAVQDNGKGMTPDCLERVFEPFYTNGKSNTGLGLGLSISHAIACRHGGTIEASSPGPGRGATFVLKLPALKEPALA